MITYIKYNGNLYRLKFNTIHTEIRRYNPTHGWYITKETFPIYEDDFFRKHEINREQVDKEVNKLEMMRSLAT